jgi:hypothetical protein
MDRAVTNIERAAASLAPIKSPLLYTDTNGIKITVTPNDNDFAFAKIGVSLTNFVVR